MGALAEVKQEWQHFKDDAPGERFRKHRDRMKQKSKKHSAVAIGLGVLLLAGGVVLLFMPGPGLLFIVFGVALVGSHSKKLSDLMDRSEPKLRRAGRRTKHRWEALPGRAKLGVIIGMASLAAAACLFMWKFVVSAYLLG
jgi:ferric-dicitrate binding protein FerR (iron transport regulator)